MELSKLAVITFQNEIYEEISKDEVIIILPDNMDFKVFQEKYNEELKIQKEIFEKIEKEFKKQVDKSNKSRLFLKKYENKEVVREDILQKIKKHEKIIDQCLSEMKEINKKRFMINDFEIIEKLGAKFLLNEIKNQGSVENPNESMEIIKMEDSV